MPAGSQSNPSCVIVLGMHRSGTSAMSGTLGLLGAKLPNNLMPGNEFNPKGYFESLALYDVNERFLSDINSSWYDLSLIDTQNLDTEIKVNFRKLFLELLNREYGEETGLFLLKDPRICRFFPLVHSAIRDFGASPYVVSIFRNPWEVAHSLKKRDGICLSHGLTLWLRHVLDAEYQSRGLPRVFVDFSDLLDDWRPTVGRIQQQLGVAMPGLGTAAEAAVEDFLDRTLRHHQPVSQRQLGSIEQTQLKACYASLFRLARDAEDERAMRIRSDKSRV